MKRRHLNFSAGASLLLCIATAAVWTGSYWLIFNIDRARVVNRTGAIPLSDWREDSMSCGWGSIAVVTTTTANDNPASAPIPGIHFRLERIQPNWTKPPVGSGTTVMNRLGFARWNGVGIKSINGVPINGFSQHWITTNLPTWLPLALSMALPANWLYDHLRRRHRGRSGVCEVCGYDLRATPDRCPECGSVPEKVNG